MNPSSEKVALEFFEMGSEQRLSIILHLNEKPWTISLLAKELDATVTEVHRNFMRLRKAGFVAKDSEGIYLLTTLGKHICTQIPTHSFILENKNYFQNHNFDGLPQKFVRRLGDLSNSKLIKGYVKVSETWKKIYSNAEEYIKNILVEVTYSSDIMEILYNKLKKNVSAHSIFSDTAVIPEERKISLAKYNFKKYLEKDLLQRKMKKDIKVALILNEKESGISFSEIGKQVDISTMFCSSDPEFHEWCLDYFQYCWEGASSFQENKLKE